MVGAKEIEGGISGLLLLSQFFFYVAKKIAQSLVAPGDETQKLKVSESFSFRGSNDHNLRE